MQQYLSIAGFAFLGGASRYSLGLLLPAQQGFPVATVTVNLIGSFLMALLIHYVVEKYTLPSALTVGLGGGFIGSFTTFSTLSLDAVRLINTGHWWLLAAYLTSTLVGGVLLSAAGVGLSRHWLSTVEVGQ